MTQEILELVRCMGADLPPDPLPQLLCQAVQQQMTLQLRPGLTPESCGPAFLTAAAFQVLAALELGDRGLALTSFQAGDLSIHQNPSHRQQQYQQQAQQLMAPYQADPHFSFQEVQG